MCSKDNEQKNEKEKYKCPISQEIMEEPVMVVESGNIYDMLSILKWFQSGRNYDPINRTQLTCPYLHFEAALQKEIKSLCQVERESNNWDDKKWEKQIETCDKYFNENLNKNDRNQEFIEGLKLKPIQLVNVDDTSQTISFADIAKDAIFHNIPIITVTGPSRNGKSTLLDDLLRYQFSSQQNFVNRFYGQKMKKDNEEDLEGKYFKISHDESKSCTKGAWLGYYSNEQQKDDTGFFSIRFRRLKP